MADSLLKLFRRNVLDAVLGLALVLMLLVGLIATWGYSAPADQGIARPGEADDGTLLRLAGSTTLLLDAYAVGGGQTQLFQSQPLPTIKIPRGASLRITGWAVDDQLRLPAGGVLAELDGGDRFRADYGGSRPDVASALHIPADINVGFDVTIPSRELQPGKHQLGFLIVAADRRGYYLIAPRVRINVFS